MIFDTSRNELRYLLNVCGNLVL